MGICREVTEFRDDLNMFTETLNNLDDDDPDMNQIKRLALNTINMINIHFNCIKNYISLYCDNRFADQFVSVSLLTSLQKLSDSCEKLQGLISAHFGTINQVHDFMETEQFTSTDEDSQIDFIDKHDEFISQSRVLINNVIEMMNIDMSTLKWYNKGSLTHATKGALVSKRSIKENSSSTGAGGLSCKGRDEKNRESCIY